jgi:hypothetical protein
MAVYDFSQRATVDVRQQTIGLVSPGLLECHA